MFWCCCGCPSSTINVTVRGCNSSFLPGVTVAITGPGGYSSTLTSNGTGFASFPVTANGTYSYTISKSRFVTATGTVTVTACNSPTVTRTLAVSAGYVCCAHCVDPVATTMYGTFSGGSVTLTYDSGLLAWYGNTGISNGSVSSCTVAGGTCTINSPGTGNAQVFFVLNCPSTSGGDWGLQTYVYSGTTAYFDNSCLTGPCPSNSVVNSLGTGTNPCGVPVALSYAISSPGSHVVGGFFVGLFPVAYPITSITIAE